MSGNKFNRGFIFRFENTPIDYIEIKNPFTIEFSITRSNLASANTASFTIYNLNETTRKTIVKDIWDIRNIKAVEFYAGYQENIMDIIPRVFKGTSKKAYSYRQGPDFRTVIEAYDGAISSNAPDVSLPVVKGTPQAVVIAQLANKINAGNKITIGNKFTEIAKRAMAIIGNPMEALQELTNKSFYIDSGNAYALDKTEVILGDIRKISSASGLLGTPRVYENMVEVEMLFEPRLKPSQLIELDSQSETRFSGVYKVTGIMHRGMISDSIGGELRTKVTMINVPGAIVVMDLSTNEYRVIGNNISQ